MSDKPLHVQVAEALGCSVMEVAGVWYDEAEVDAAEARHDSFSARPIPHYDTDWSATGPLIEKYKITLEHYEEPGFFNWRASTADVDCNKWDAPITGETPLLAVCHLILALKEAGKL